MKYVKLDLTFGDKLKLILFGLVSEDKLPTKEVEKERIVIQNSSNVPVTPLPSNINTEEKLELNIPFFSDEDVKTNF